MFGRSRLLFYADQPGSSTVFLYSAYAPAQRLGPRVGGVSADTSTTIATDTLTQPGSTSYGKKRGPFGVMGARDLLRFYVGGTLYTRIISSVTNNNAVVVDTAITLSGCSSWDWQKASRGLGDQTDPAGSTLGWVSIVGWQKPTVLVNIGTLPTDGFSVAVETRDPENSGNSLFETRAMTGLTSPGAIFINNGAAKVRVGIKAATPGGVSTGSVTITLVDAAVVR